MEIQKSVHAPRSIPEIKDKVVESKLPRRKGSDVDSRWHNMEFFVLSCIDKRRL